MNEETDVSKKVILEQQSDSEGCTEEIGAAFARRIEGQNDAFLWLKGDLGAGKTAFRAGNGKRTLPRRTGVQSHLYGNAPVSGQKHHPLPL